MKDKREARKEEIIQAAMTVFGKHGFHEAKMEAIAAEAGIGKGTLYEYFTSKKELFRQMVAYKLNEYMKGIQAVIDREGTTREKLINFTVYHGQMMRMHQSKTEMIFFKSDALPEEFIQWVMEGQKRVLHLIHSLVAEGIRRGELRKDLSKEMTTTMIVGTIKAYHMDRMYFSQDMKETNEQVDASQLIDMIMKGIEG